MSYIKTDQQYIPAKHSVSLITRVKASQIKEWLANVPDDAILVKIQTTYGEEPTLIFEELEVGG